MLKRPCVPRRGSAPIAIDGGLVHAMACASCGLPAMPPNLHPLDVALARALAARFINEGHKLAAIFRRRNAGEVLTDKEQAALARLERPYSVRELLKWWPEKDGNEG